MTTPPYAERMACFSCINVRVSSIEKQRIKGIVEFVIGEQRHSFEMIFTYSENISVDENIAGLIITMPVINFAYFSKEIILNYPVSPADRVVIEEWTKVNNREVFINQICRRRYEFFNPEYIPDSSDITPENSYGITKISFPVSMEEKRKTETNPDGVGILSSGGKESLLSSGIFSEIGTDTYHIFYNESGAHWLPAKTAYDHMISSGKKAEKVWSNTDRFYRFGLRLLPCIDMDVVEKKADSYPVQAFIFPVYIFALLPIAIKERLGNLIMGDEFDDPLEMSDFHGMKHFYGVYDQSNTFNSRITRYFMEKGLNITVWSAVYAINGSVEEKILMRRYPHLFSLQRSCHSCRKIVDQIIPCGTCSKCLGIMLFIIAARGDPRIIGYRDDHIMGLEKNIAGGHLRLDRDELDLLKERVFKKRNPVGSHVDMLHVFPEEKAPLSFIPDRFRDKIDRILSQYVTGKCRIENGSWKKF
ncbi:MAG: metal-binding protein [Candidatus Thermoplasmatota archaeon]|nr:metal-binding protein [Candidatus Thermoplasmatota archaeon]